MVPVFLYDNTTDDQNVLAFLSVNCQVSSCPEKMHARVRCTESMTMQWGRVVQVVSVHCSMRFDPSRSVMSHTVGLFGH